HNVGGSSVILSLVPDGTFVKEGELLCQLDPSEYEEIVIEQQIKVEEAVASKQRAELDLEVAKLAVTEYEKGLKHQAEKDYRGQVALAEAEVQRANDRLSWSKKLETKGYASKAQLATDKWNLQRAEANLTKLRGAYDLFLSFEAPHTLRELTSQVESTELDFTFQSLRLKRHRERLSHYEKQVKHCTIRAPHDGFVVYARRRPTDPPLEEGMRVHQKQELFDLPDLAEMEVQAVLSESVVDRVRDGQPTRVHIEALPNQVLEGEVIFVGRIPTVNHWMLSQDVKNYLGRVKLHSVPRGLLPGMTAQVEIVTEQRPNALVIPPAAVANENGHEVCYVASADGFERREVTIGTGTRELLEVTDGLTEGEEVVLDPAAHNLAATDSRTEPAEPAPEPAAQPAPAAISQ
ncbi:MAG TPA: efflux RND transporter periplasmic adaptor subunit, partial [Isosphaeraceae bacterium]|nr:efflux RND transporter periplasmic adaptor subunit [Isosphaeraceae bacterium]